METKQCRVCSSDLIPGTDRALSNIAPSGLKNKCYICRKCDKVQHKSARDKDPSKANSRAARWKLTHPNQVKASHKQYRQDNAERIKTSSRAYAKTDHAKEVHRAWAQALKAEVLTHYGNGCYACVRCGFDDLRALSIDHINGSGTEHRRQLNGGGVRTYSWLRSQNYPEGYQVLCMNCQFIKRIENNEFRLPETY